MITIALLIALSTPLQTSGNPRAIIELKKDVEVTHHEGLGGELRGKLYLEDVSVRPFRLKKGQRFQMLKIGQEGGCRIRVEKKEYDVTSCPWLPGFRDHQSDIFQIVTK
jgi:hypothetical protein